MSATSVPTTLATPWETAQLASAAWEDGTCLRGHCQPGHCWPPVTPWAASIGVLLLMAIGHDSIHTQSKLWMRRSEMGDLWWPWAPDLRELVRYLTGFLEFVLFLWEEGARERIYGNVCLWNGEWSSLRVYGNKARKTLVWDFSLSYKANVIMQTHLQCSNIDSPWRSCTS